MLMYKDDRTLLKKLTVLVGIKVVVVYFLWVFLIKDYRVSIDHADQFDDHFFQSNSTDYPADNATDSLNHSPAPNTDASQKP